MQLLTLEEQQRLVGFIAEDFTAHLTREEFEEISLNLFEDIPGLEAAQAADIQVLINQLWKFYMTKTNDLTTTSTDEKSAVPKDTAKYKLAVLKGQEIIAADGTKADAARAIYEMIQSENKEVIIQAFRDGATVTEKGAPTYFYNVVRWFKKKQRSESDTAKKTA